jgi:hypothetical protein
MKIFTFSSRKIREEFADEVKKYYWKSVLWNESYFIASCGGVTISVLKKYIEQQDTPEDSPSAGHRTPEEDGAYIPSLKVVPLECGDESY